MIYCQLQHQTVPTEKNACAGLITFLFTCYKQYITNLFHILKKKTNRATDYFEKTTVLYSGKYLVEYFFGK